MSAGDGMMTTLLDWNEAFRALEEHCPWAGPRPLRNSDDDRKRLFGREVDAQYFKEEVKQHQLVVLTGESGVGKSSLLNAYLLRTLEQAGFQPFVCGNWTWPGDEVMDVDQIIRSKIKTDWNPTQGGHPQGSLCDELDAVYGHTAVLIFDQFEELIRYQPAVFNGIVAWILDANRRNRTHIVLSLRLEYRHHLRPIEKGARPYSMSTRVLEALTEPAAVKRIISDAEAGTAGAITPAAAELLLDQWLTVQTRSSGRNDVSLLQLQGTLYALHAQAQTAGKVDPNPIDVHHVTDFINRIEAENSKSFKAEMTVFDLGLREAVRLKLERCRDACMDASLPRPLDDTLVEGTNAIAHRLIPHLSSVGYKLVREEWELARITLSRELERLTRSTGEGDDRPTNVEIERVFRNLRSRSRPASGDGADAARTAEVEELDDVLSVSRSEIARASNLPWPTPLPSALLQANGVDVAPWEADRYDVSSGHLLGMSASVVLIEELRRLVFALHWLEAALLVRASSPAPGQTMLSLIHDGFASALEHWAASTHPGPRHALIALSASRGETYQWLRVDKPVQPLDEFDGSKRKVTLTNLRWRDCQVMASFREVVFVNCDFRGTRFRECRFRGVVFVNCLLDGVTFEECTILGQAGDPPPVSRVPADLADRAENPLLVDTLRLPAFRVQVTADQVSELRRYRELPPATDGESNQFLYSRTSGLAAVPWERSYGLGLNWQRETGGLTMYGGRLSSLMIRGCRFDDGGSLALRYIAGSALDIVEQVGGGRIDIAMSLIRGFTVTRPVDSRAETNSRGALDIEVLDSFMTNVWFGDNLYGNVAFKSCKLWQVCNISDQASFNVAIIDSTYYGLLNVSTPDAKSAQMSDDFVSNPRTREELARDVMSMDYRSVPARLELTKSE
jgi:hypothetical protein